MKYHLLIHCIFLCLFYSCSNNANNDAEVFSQVQNQQLEIIISKIDSLVILHTSEKCANHAYISLLERFDYYCSTTTIITDFHDFLIEIQTSSVFNEIWLFKWAMDIETMECDLWLDLNESQGIFWKTILNDANQLGPKFSDVFYNILFTDARVAFNVLQQEAPDLIIGNSIEHNILSVLILTKVINAF